MKWLKSNKVAVEVFQKNKRQLRNIRKRKSYDFWVTVFRGHIRFLDRVLDSQLKAADLERMKEQSVIAALALWRSMDHDWKFITRQNSTWNLESLILAHSDWINDLQIEQEEPSTMPYTDSFDVLTRGMV